MEDTMCGHGLEQGKPSFEGYTRARRQLQKDVRGEISSYFFKAVVGGSFVGERLGNGPVCLHCGDIETACHR